MSDEQPVLRVALVGIIVVSMFAALFARLYYLQVLRETTVEEVFGGPRLREVTYEGVRGRILDRNGTVLVDNRESIVVTIDRRQFDGLKDPGSLKLRLARALNDAGVPTKVSDITARIEDPRYDPLKPVPVAEDVSAELEAYLLERLYEFPSVDVVRTQIRTYPHGTLAAHVLGYTGAINSDELEARAQDPKAYEPGDQIGKAGVERIFESELRATPGQRTVEVDATEREIGTRADVASVPGADLQLTIDAKLQQHVEAELRDGLAAARQQKKRRPTDPELRAPAGAVVVLDADTAEVLALASYPTYDPSEFIGGISAYRFNELNDPAAFFPFNNRAIQSLYSPGSTFKPITAVAALERGVIRPEDTIMDNGTYELDNCTDTCVFQNAGGTRYGRIDLVQAMTVSSDVYFYRLGEQMWVNQGAFGQSAIQDTARRFGLGTATGIQLPGEAAGLISDPAFKKARHDENPDAFPYGEWFTGDNVNLAIGQGDVGVTPLQLANAYAALANGGVLHAPSVAKALLDHDSGEMKRSYAARTIGTVELPATVREPIVTGLERVLSDADGTAHAAFDGFPLGAFDIAGKTGTAEVPPLADTSIFAAFGPLPNPRYVVVAVLEESGFASETAAPLVRRVFEALDEVRPLVPLPSTAVTVAGVANGSTTTAATAATAADGDAADGSSGDSTPATTTTAASTATTAVPAPPSTSTTAPPAPPATEAPSPTTTVTAPPTTAPEGAVATAPQTPAVVGGAQNQRRSRRPSQAGPRSARQGRPARGRPERGRPERGRTVLRCRC